MTENVASQNSHVLSCQHNVAIASEHSNNVVFHGIKGNTVSFSGIFRICNSIFNYFVPICKKNTFSSLKAVDKDA